MRREIAPLAAAARLSLGRCRGSAARPFVSSHRNGPQPTAHGRARGPHKHAHFSSHIYTTHICANFARWLRAPRERDLALKTGAGTGCFCSKRDAGRGCWCAGMRVGAGRCMRAARTRPKVQHPRAPDNGHSKKNYYLLRVVASWRSRYMTVCHPAPAKIPFAPLWLWEERTRRAKKKPASNICIIPAVAGSIFAGYRL